MKTLELQKTHSGQFRYRILSLVDDSFRVSVDWEFGTFSQESTIEQAKERFLGNAPFNLESR